MTGDWKTQPGERLTRAQLAAHYGGNPRAGRIMVSDTTANVLLFADPVERSRPWEVNDGPTEARGPSPDVARSATSDCRRTGRCGTTSPRDAR